MDLIQSIKNRIENSIIAQAELEREKNLSENKNPDPVKIDLKDHKIRLEKLKREFWRMNDEKGNVDDYEKSVVELLSYWSLAENKVRSELTDVYEGKEVSNRELMEIGLLMRNELLGIQVRTNFHWLLEGLNKPANSSITPNPSDIDSSIKALRSGNKEEMLKATVALGQMGAPAIPALIDVIKDFPAGRKYATVALEEIGTSSIFPLVELLQSGGDGVWNYAATALGDIGASAMEPLIEILSRSQGENVLSHISVALEYIGDKAVQPLNLALKENRIKGEGRLYTAIALKKIGKSAIPSLEMLATDANPAVCYVANEALTKLTGQPRIVRTIPENKVSKEKLKTTVINPTGKKVQPHRNWFSGAKDLFHRQSDLSSRSTKKDSATYPKCDNKVPAKYNPKLHYNCFIETVPAKDRQAVYQELYRRGLMAYSHVLQDGRLQLSMLNLGSGLDAYNDVAREKVLAAELTKARLIQLMATNPDLEMTFIKKTNDPHVLHAEKARLAQLVVNSEDMFRKGVSHHEKKQYQQAISCYNEAIKIEPEDVRAWNNKIIALGQSGNLETAIQVANEALRLYPDIAFLWETKGTILGWMGKLIEAGECNSSAAQMDPSISKKHESRYAPEDKRFQKLLAECRKQGKDPERDVQFWFNKFAEYVDSGDAEGVSLCLQMAATVGPEYIVMYDNSTMTLLPPGHMLLSDELRPVGVKTERLRDYFDKLTTNRMRK